MRSRQEVIGPVNHETVKDSQRLFFRQNGISVPTFKGLLAHELVQREVTVRANNDPRIEMAMSPDMLDSHIRRIRELDKTLTMPRDPKKRKRRISRYRRTLLKEGFPYWRMISK